MKGVPFVKARSANMVNSLVRTNSGAVVRTMMVVDGLVGNLLGGVAAKAGVDGIMMDNLGGGVIEADDLLRMEGKAVVGMEAVVDGLDCEGRDGVATEAGAD